MLIFGKKKNTPQFLEIISTGTFCTVLHDTVTCQACERMLCLLFIIIHKFFFLSTECAVVTDTEFSTCTAAGFKKNGTRPLHVSALTVQ